MGDPSISIRQAVQSDSGTIRKMVRSAHLNPWGLNWLRFKVAVDEDNQIIGCIQYRQHRDGSQELSSLVVKPEYRGRGIAHLLVEALLHNRERAIYLYCREDLANFYRRFDFQRLSLDEMPPSFRLPYRFVNFLKRFFGLKNGLAVMGWYPPE